MLWILSDSSPEIKVTEWNNAFAGYALVSQNLFCGLPNTEAKAPVSHTDKLI